MDTSYTRSVPSATDPRSADPAAAAAWHESPHDTNIVITISNTGGDGGSTGRGILIGMLSAFGSAAFVVLLFAVFYFFRYTRRGRIFLDRIGRPGEYDDEQALAREEAEALEEMDDLQRIEYSRAKAFIQANPPETLPTDISLSQFLAIQEKGVSAWEFEPELEIANCFVEARTEIEFFDSACSVQSNLPIPKQNEVYYWEAKIYEKPESSLISIGVSTKPYPLFRLPGWHKCSLAYVSTGQRRYNQPFQGTNYGPEFVQGDVIGVGYRPRTGSIFFTRNGKKLDDVIHGLKSQNFFPTVGANGPCTVHVNFGQSGFVFIEANVKKWGLAPMTGSLAPPPPYGSEQGSILLETGRDGVGVGGATNTNFVVSPSVGPGQGYGFGYGPGHQGHIRAGSRNMRVTTPTSPGPQRSPTEISLAQLVHVPSHEDVGEGTSRSARASSSAEYDFPAVAAPPSLPPLMSPLNDYQRQQQQQPQDNPFTTHDPQDFSAPPPEYSSPVGSIGRGRRHASLSSEDSASSDDQSRPPIPSYEAAVGNVASGSVSGSAADARTRS